MLYSKNGSYPSPQTDGTDGWIEVEDAPQAPEGQEVVWWFPPGWVVRDPKPVDRAGYRWKWNQDTTQWIEYEIPVPAPVVVEEVITPDETTSPPAAEEPVVNSTSEIASLTTDSIQALSTTQIQDLTTEQIGGLSNG